MILFRYECLEEPGNHPGRRYISSSSQSKRLALPQDNTPERFQGVIPERAAENSDGIAARRQFCSKYILSLLQIEHSAIYMEPVFSLP